MSDASESSTADLLARVRGGDRAALEQLLASMYEELRSIARRQMAHQAPGHTLQTTALVHEAWIRLCGGDAPSIELRAQLLSLAATAMRTALVDHARARSAQKRGGGAVRLELDERVAGAGGPPEVVLALNEALERLGRAQPELARVAELHCFGGLCDAEVAEVLGVSERTAERRWREARAFLRRELELGDERESAG